MLVEAAALPAVAGEPQALAPGDSGRAVKRLQIQVAGWFPLSKRRVYFAIDGIYGSQTARAVARMQRHYGLKGDGIARRSVLKILRRLRDSDGSTRHFDWGEFNQNRNSACSARANAYAGTFGGGMVSARRARRHVRRLMWRLEVLRARTGSNPIGVNSGFRSVPYNDCIGGARSSQHLYGTAADNRVAGVRNRRSRRVAKKSEFHGIGCYSSLTHNHFDIRMDNRALRSSRSWWWPDRDSKGRDLDAAGRPCWGQRRRRNNSGDVALGTVRALGAQAGSLVPSPAEVRAFAAAGEPRHLHGAD
jgi:hypothetical protein